MIKVLKKEAYMVLSKNELHKMIKSYPEGCEGFTCKSFEVELSYVDDRKKIQCNIWKY